MITLNVVEKSCTFSGDMRQGKVTIECSEEKNFTLAFELLTSMSAREQALSYARSRGMGNPGVNGIASHPYPVNAEGQSLDEVKDADGSSPPPNDPRMKPKRYRVDVPVAQGQ